MSKHLKEELAYAIDKWFHIISYVMLFKMVIYTTKKIKNKDALLLSMYRMFANFCGDQIYVDFVVFLIHDNL